MSNARRFYSQWGIPSTLAAKGLSITIEANEKIMNFLVVTFNLKRSTYQPFTKPDTSLQYVHRERNHPPITTKNIPAGINKRSRSSIPESTRRKRIPLHPTVRTSQSKQMEKLKTQQIKSSGTTPVLA